MKMLPALALSLLPALWLTLPLSAETLTVPDGKTYHGKRIVAKTYDSRFALGHDSYNAMGTGSDGKIYYVLSSESIEQGAKMFCLDPRSQKITQIADLTEACGEKDAKAIPQGKSHVNFVEANGKLYFGTHVGVYSIVDGMETMGIPPAGMKPYPGGHLLAYDLRSGKFEDFGIAPGREGILSFNMDTKRGRLFALTWPSGVFYRYDLATKNQKSFGKQCAEGEAAVGANYRTVCRSIAVDLDDGSAYFTTSEGTILRYDPATDGWTPIAASPTGGRKKHQAFWDATRHVMIVWGGEGDLLDDHDDGAVYDPAADAWTAFGGAADHVGVFFGFGASALLADGKLWVIGGESSTGEVLAATARFDAALGVWTRMPDLSHARSSASVAWTGAPFAWGGFDATFALEATGETLDGLP